MAPTATPTAAPTIVVGACLPGFIWRQARFSDHVCVTPAERSTVVVQNSLAASRRSPSGGAYGPFTCLSGFVWRIAFSGDFVCVTPAERSAALAQNALAASRRVH